jgi:hypothetical protein
MWASPQQKHIDAVKENLAEVLKQLSDRKLWENQLGKSVFDNMHIHVVGIA